MHAKRIIALAVLAALVGCQTPRNRNHETRVHTRDTEPQTSVPTTVPSQQTAAEAQSTDPAVIRFQTQTLESYAQAITNAPTREAQLANLQRLWQHMRDQNYTYDLKATRLSDGAAVPNPATSNEQLQVDMSIFQSNRKLHQFIFRPLQNADLASLTQGGT